MSEGDCRDSVLVIDDDADFRELIAMIGEIHGVPVLQAADCRKGLKVLASARTRIKMIILDYSMPGMDAGSCAAAIKAEAGPGVSVVLLTAAADPALRAAELKIRRWLSKPVDASVLTSLLSEQIDLKV